MLNGESRVTSAWSVEVAAAAARLSRDVYKRGGKGARELETMYKARGYDFVWPFRFGVPGVQGVLMVGKAHAWLAYRGTEPDRPEDIAADLDIPLDVVPWGPARAHGGFLGQLMQTPLDVFGVAVHAARDVPLIITGHSLGGALAVIAASKLRARSVSIAGVYTFGAPRPGDALLARSIAHVPVWRVVRSADVVSRRPELLVLKGYRHAGDLRYIDRQGHLARGPGELARLIDRTCARIKSRRPLRVALDHHDIDGYVSALEKMESG